MQPSPVMVWFSILQICISGRLTARLVYVDTIAMHTVSNGTLVWIPFSSSLFPLISCTKIIFAYENLKVKIFLAYKFT